MIDFLVDKIHDVRFMRQSPKQLVSRVVDDFNLTK